MGPSQRTMQDTVVSAFDPESADPAPVGLATAAARLLAARLLVVVVRPGGSAAERLARVEDVCCHEDAIDSLRRRLAPRGTELREVRHPSASAGLHDVLRRERAALAVVGSADRCADGRVHMGRTGERVLDGAPCPVAVVPRGHITRTIRDVAVAVLPSPEGRAALRTAAGLARAVGAPLRVVMVLSGMPRAEDARAIAAQLAGDAPSARGASAILASAVAEAVAPLEVRTDVLVGDPADALVRASGRADVLVLGSRAYGPAGTVLAGGVARGVLDGARCPVVIVPRGGAGDRHPDPAREEAVGV
jgi:nucleotide-binding universal stress UspA family protein